MAAVSGDDREGAFFRPNEPAVVSETFDDETILLNLATGAYYTLNDSAGALWRLIVGGCRRDALAAVASGAFGADVAGAETDRFLDRLLDYQLVVPATGGEAGVEADDRPQPAFRWSEPTIAVYGDMKDLLAIDPPLPPMRSGSS